MHRRVLVVVLLPAVILVGCSTRSKPRPASRIGDAAPVAAPHARSIPDAAAPIDAEEYADGAPQDDAPPEPPTSFSCSTGVLFAGDPTYAKDEAPNPKGVALRGDPPLAWGALDFLGDTLYTSTGSEIWVADSIADGAEARRLIGMATPGGAPPFRAGACADARLGAVESIAAFEDGSLVLPDHLANALLRVTDPGSAKCKVAYLAGNATEVPALDPVNPPALGDRDGRGAAARLRGPLLAIGDGEGNVLFVDGGNSKLKRVTPAGEVSTLVVLPRDVDWRGITLLDGKLYLAGESNGHGSRIQEVSLSGNQRKVLEARGEIWGLDSSISPALDAITTDGTNLLVTGRGSIYHVTLHGKVTWLAGRGVVPDFPPRGYDPVAVHPAKELALKKGNRAFMAWHEGALYWAGNASAAYVLKVSCGE